MAEYVNMIVASALTVTLFFGGWSMPGYEPHGWVGVIVSALIFFAKTAIFVWIFIWVRWTLPRFRYDQLMRLGWKALLPIALLNLLWVAFLVVRGWIS
jgi:NADH-quinone oxidoreductase subunit H